MAKDPVLSSEEAKDADKQAHHVNSLIYAAGDSRVQGILWGGITSIISFAAFFFGMNNPKTSATFGNLAKYVTLPEHKIKTFISNFTKSAPPAANTGKNAPLTAAIALGFIVNHLAQIPVFERARRKVNRINAECDATRDENEMLKQENLELKKAVGSSSGVQLTATPDPDAQQSTKFRDSIPQKTANGFREGVINAQKETKEITGPSAV